MSPEVAVRRFVLPVVLSVAACRPEYDVTGFVGEDGELRFNLTFTNEQEVDLDLHVVTPAGEEIYYGEKTDSTGGELDVDCFCGNCEQGPAENVFWEYGGAAAAGEYSVSVEYFTACDLYDYYGYSYGYYPDPVPSDYTLRVMENGAVLQTYEGTLADYGAADTFTHTFDGTAE